MIDGNKSPAHSSLNIQPAKQNIIIFSPTFHILLFFSSFSSLKLGIFLYSLKASCYLTQTYMVHLHRQGFTLEVLGARGGVCVP